MDKNRLLGESPPCRETLWAGVIPGSVYYSPSEGLPRDFDPLPSLNRSLSAPDLRRGLRPPPLHYSA